MQTIEQSEGYQKLLSAIEADTKSGWSLENRMKKLSFAVDRAKHYEEKTGIPAGDILTAWERRRNYWYMNYYQDAQQPKLEGEAVRIFQNVDEAWAMMGESGFRCPKCGKISGDPYECDQKPCDWKVYGLFRALGKGVYVFCKDEMQGDLIFMPIAWEPVVVGN